MNKYLIPFSILVIVALALNLKSNQVEIKQETYDNLHKTLKMQADRDWKELENSLEELSLGLHERRKVSFRSLKSLVAYLNTYQQDLEELLYSKQLDQEIAFKNNKRVLDKLQAFIINRDSGFLILHDSIMKANYRKFSLRKEEMKVRISSLHRDIAKYSIPNAFEIAKRDDLQFRLNLQMIQNMTLMKINFMKEQIAELQEGRVVCDWKMDFPMVYAKKNCLNSGEFFEAEIRIGTFYTNFEYDLPKIFVNGDSIRVDSFGRGHYKTKATKAGEIDLNIQYEMINPLTGQVSIGGSVYSYQVN